MWQGTEGGYLTSQSADELIELLDVDENGTVSPEEFAKFRASVAVLGSLPDADAATAAAIECKFTPRVETDDSLDDEDEDEDMISAADISKINVEDGTAAGQELWTMSSSSDEPVVDVSIASMEKARSMAAKMDEETDEGSGSFSEDEVEDAVAAFAAAQAMSPPPLPPAPPRAGSVPRMRPCARRPSSSRISKAAKFSGSWCGISCEPGGRRRRASSFTSEPPRTRHRPRCGSSGLGSSSYRATPSDPGGSTAPRCCTRRAVHGPGRRV